MPIESKAELFSALSLEQKRLQEFGVKRLGVFGSFAREQQKAGSDVDMIVEFQPDQKSFDNFIRLCSFLEEIFGRKVELVTPESLSPSIGPHILQQVEYAKTGR